MTGGLSASFSREPGEELCSSVRRDPFSGAGINKSGAHGQGNGSEGIGRSTGNLRRPHAAFSGLVIPVQRGESLDAEIRRRDNVALRKEAALGRYMSFEDRR